LIERTIGNRPIIINFNNEDVKDNVDNKDDLDDNSNNKYLKIDDKAEEYILIVIE
jgi:hypothetical protein